MKNYNEMKKFVKNSNGIITYSAMIENGISKYYITKLVKDNIIKNYSIYGRKIKGICRTAGARCVCSGLRLAYFQAFSGMASHASCSVWSK